METITTLFEETSRDFVRFVRNEARRWKRYVRVRTDGVTTTARSAREALTARGLERTVLARVDATLRELGARVRVRLTKLENKRHARRRPPVARKKRTSSATPATGT